MGRLYTGRAAVEPLGPAGGKCNAAHTMRPDS
jgi:hypothetical protein